MGSRAGETRTIGSVVLMEQGLARRDRCDTLAPMTRNRSRMSKVRRTLEVRI
jgi:hypothetical protein